MPVSTTTRNRKKLIDDVEHRRRQLVTDVEELHKLRSTWGDGGRLSADSLAQMYENCHFGNREPELAYFALRSVESENESMLGRFDLLIQSAERQIRDLGKLAEALDGRR